MKKKVNRYTDEFKYKVVLEYLNSDSSYEVIMRKYGIKGDGCISSWRRKFGLSNPSDDQLMLNKSMSEEIEKTARERELEAKVKELEGALAHEKLRSLALNTIIDIAERDLKIPIRKKPGTKR
jgi:transposase